MNITPQKARHFRSLGHKLKPVVIVAGKGLSDNILREIDRALDDHELIKISIRAADRRERANISEQICARCQATLVQRIGNVSLLYRASLEPNPRLSNLLRPL